jgi:hypothetical protein
MTERGSKFSGRSTLITHGFAFAPADARGNSARASPPLLT